MYYILLYILAYLYVLKKYRQLATNTNVTKFLMISLRNSIVKTFKTTKLIVGNKTNRKNNKCIICAKCKHT